MEKVKYIKFKLGKLNPSRITRIARGSGTSVEEVHVLLEEHKKLASVVGNLANANIGGKRMFSM